VARHQALDGLVRIEKCFAMQQKRQADKDGKDGKKQRDAPRGMRGKLPDVAMPR
jgi:hypothetical protein